jgi:hypothetical protein
MGDFDKQLKTESRLSRKSGVSQKPGGHQNHVGATLFFSTLVPKLDLGTEISAKLSMVGISKPSQT